nr:MAG TPA: hypothetical protein [Caudoviricetes sp.]DAR41174.1 MAG TPA: hypothetical protein [Caudoviricetes sp.]
MRSVFSVFNFTINGIICYAISSEYSCTNVIY